MKLLPEDYGSILVVLLAIASILYFSGSLEDPIEPPYTSGWEWYSDPQIDPGMAR